MSDKVLNKSDFASALLRLFPPLLRGAALDDHNFRQQVGLATDAVVRLDSSEVTFKRSAFFYAIRQIYGDPGRETTVSDESGAVWRVNLNRSRDSVSLERGDKRYALNNFVGMSSSQTERLDWFDKEAARLELKDEHSLAWRSILSDRAVEDEEFDELFSDMRQTPLSVGESIAAHLRGEELSLLVLVPSDIRYYDRLVGAPLPAGDLVSYVKDCATPMFKSWVVSGSEGLKRSLLFSSHSLFSNAIPLAKYSKDEVLTLFSQIENGDRISQVGALEVGILYLEEFPELEPYIARIAELIAADLPQDPEGRMALLSSLIVLVDGEMARTGVGSDRPVFWRRLAAIAHASLIEREVIAIGVRPSIFQRWAFSARGSLFYLRAFIDLRMEPRWLPDFMTEHQLKAELLGRVFHAGFSNTEKFQFDSTRDIFSLNENALIKSQLKFPFAFLPGPLEGGVESISEMPPDIEANLKQALESEQPTADDFISLVNSPLIFKIGPQLAQLATHAIRRAKYQLQHTKSHSDPFSLLSGLATVAAVTRSAELADEVRILVRVFRRTPGIEIAPEDAMRIALIAAASNSEKPRWCKFLGDWLTEISYEDMSQEIAEGLLQHIQLLCKLEPDLWETCGRSEASLSAYISSAA